MQSTAVNASSSPLPAGERSTIRELASGLSGEGVTGSSNKSITPSPRPSPRRGEGARVLTGRAVLIWLVVFFGVVFGVNGLMMKLALDTMSGTEVDSAYRAGITFNAEVQAAQRQAERGWQVTGQVARTAQAGVSVRVEARDKAGAPVSGVAFYGWLDRPTDKRADRRVALTERQPGRYQGEVADIAAGQWDLVLEASRGDERLFLSKTRVWLK
jgi:nitrogen fixation protein FixH